MSRTEILPPDRPINTEPESAWPDLFKEPPVDFTVAEDRTLNLNNGTITDNLTGETKMTEAARPQVVDFTPEERAEIEQTSKAPAPAEEAPASPFSLRAGDVTAEELFAFWQQTAESDAKSVVPKAIEYGAADLKVMGEAMECLFRAARKGNGLEPLSEEESRKTGIMMALTFYQLGKVARMFGAYERGVAPSFDTLLDDSIYSFMLRKVEATGFWV